MMLRVFTTILLLAIGGHLTAQEYQLSKPLVKMDAGGFFEKKARVTFDFRLEGVSLYYTLDGTEPTEESHRYKKKLTIRKSSTLKVKAFKDGFLPSETVTTKLLQLGEKIEDALIRPEPNKAYSGNGAATLTDQQAGSLNFKDGNWLGYNKGPIIVTLDLGHFKPVNEIVISTLTSAGSWIMSPTSIVAYGSLDGAHFIKKHELSIPLQKQNAPSGKVYYSLPLLGLKYRAVQLVITPLGSLPDWHPGKGNAGWLFLDEIIIR